jgi:hypothetical protein
MQPAFFSAPSSRPSVSAARQLALESFPAERTYAPPRRDRFDSQTEASGTRSGQPSGATFNESDTEDAPRRELESLFDDALALLAT